MSAAGDLPLSCLSRADAEVFGISNVRESRRAVEFPPSGLYSRLPLNSGHCCFRTVKNGASSAGIPRKRSATIQRNRHEAPMTTSGKELMIEASGLCKYYGQF